MGEVDAYVFASAAVVPLFHQALVDLENMEELLVCGVVDEHTFAIWTRDGEALLVVPRFPTEEMFKHLGR